MKITWFWDRFLNNFGPPKWHLKSTQNHVKSMLRPILGQDGSNKRSSVDFASNFHWFLLILMWSLFDIQMMLHSIFIQFWIDYEMHFATELDILSNYCLSVCTQHTCEQWQHENSRSTEHRQWPAPVPLQPLLLRFRPECLFEGCWNWFCSFWDRLRSSLQPNTTCCQIAVFKCVKNYRTYEQWQH